MAKIKMASIKFFRQTARYNFCALGLFLAIPGLAQADNEGVPLRGFVDVGFAAHSKQATVPKGFNVGSLDFYLTPQFDDNLKALIEIIFETTSDGSIATDLERAQMGYTFNDNATLWAGRFHAPFGYWNTGFHHGAEIQTAVLRPRFLDFEDKGGILPVHMVGLWGTGKLNAGDNFITYDVYAGNGPKISMAEDAGIQAPGTLNINTAGDNNHQAMLGVNFGYEFSGNLSGLRLALHALRGDVDDDSNGLIPGIAAANKTGLGMVGGAIIYIENDWEVMGEYYRFNNKDKSGSSGSHTSWADYLQVGKTINNITPFLRVEKTQLNQSDNYFSMQESGQSYNRQALGVKYDLNEKAALKFELLNTRFATGGLRVASSYRSFLAQFAIRF